MKLRWLIVVLFFSSFLAYGGDSFHVTTTGGGAGNDGSINQPWRLSYALRDSGGVVGAGDTIWVHGGNYKGTFTCSLNGSEGSPIIVRNYNRERACIYDSVGTSTTYLWTFDGSHVWLWGIEFKGTGNDKYTTMGQPITDIDFPSGISVGGGSYHGLRVINCIVHDIGTGIESWSNSHDAEVYGNLIIFYSIENSNQLHATYCQNTVNTHRKYIKDNIILHPTGKGTGHHLYGQEGALDSITASGNIMAGIRTDGGSAGLFYGPSGANPTYGAIVDSNYIYKSALNVGYFSPGHYNVRVRGNVQYRTGTTSGFDVDLKGDDVVVENNIMIPNGKAYHSVPSWSEGVLTDSFPSNTAYTSAPTSGVWQYVRANAYESKRGHLAIYNWADLDSVWVKLTGVISNGDSFYIYNAQNFYGDIPFKGVYQDSIRFPMTTARWTVADAKAVTDPDNLLPEFGAFIVTGTSHGGGTPATPQPMKRLKGRKR